MLKPTFFAALAAVFLLAGEAAASQDEATNHFLEGVAATPHDAIVSTGAGQGRTRTFMISNPGNLTAFVAGCDNACRGISVQMRAAGLAPIVVGSALASPRTAMLAIPQSYRRTESNLEVRITMDCARGQECDFVWGALAEGSAASSTIPTLTASEWNGAGETLTRSALRWTQRPSGEDLMFYYPIEAMNANSSGTARLECVIMAGGRFRCRTAEETPAGQSFGSAAMRLTALLRVEETDAEGQSLVGRRVVLPIRFEPPG